MEKIVISTIYSDLSKSDKEQIIDCKSHKHALKLFKDLRDKLSKQYQHHHEAASSSWGSKQGTVFTNRAGVNDTEYVVLQRVVCSQRHYDEVMMTFGVLIPF